MNRKIKKTRAAQLFEELEHVAEFMPAPLYWLDINGIVLGFNNILSDQLGGPEIRGKIIGKSHDDFYPPHVAKILNENNRKVIETGQKIEFEEEVVNVVTGQTKYYTAIRAPWRDENGKIIGIIGTSIEITDRKEKERLTLENQRQQVALQEKENFAMIARKVAHDIRSPLQAVNSMLNVCNELPEEKRTALRKSLNSAFKILYSLANNYKNDPNLTWIESRQNLLIADYVAEVLEEKEYQYIHHKQPINFKLTVTDPAKTAYIEAQASQLCRALSNIINNAIEALPETRNGVIQVLLDADEKKVGITISDNGNGMASETVQKIQTHIPFTENKTDGQGLGLQQVWDMLEFNRGKMKVASTISRGTSVQLTFPRSEPADWLAQEIVLFPNTILLILDDETLLHQAWGLRLDQIVRPYRELQVKYFDQGNALLDFVKTLTDAERARVLLLADYELTYQMQNGLQIIINSQITNAILITGHSSNADIRKVALELGINLLPKQLLSATPIRLDKNLQNVA